MSLFPNSKGKKSGSGQFRLCVLFLCPQLGPAGTLLSDFASLTSVQERYIFVGNKQLFVNFRLCKNEKLI